MRLLPGADDARNWAKPGADDVRMWVKPKDATLGTSVFYRPEGPDHDWRAGVLVAQVGDVWWIEVRS